MIELLINGYEHYENERKSKDDENNRVYKLGGWEFLDIANKLFDNEKQVD